MDGFHLQLRDLACVKDEIAVLESVELSFCVVTEELEVRVVHVRGWAGRINTGETVVEAEWEAYVGNVATGSHACRIGGSNYVGGEEKKK